MCGHSFKHFYLHLSDVVVSLNDDFRVHVPLGNDFTRQHGSRVEFDLPVKYE
jgi:hypothetical protein